MKNLLSTFLLALACACGAPLDGRDGENGINGVDGTNGQDGNDGAAGNDGSSCSIVENGDGSADMVCEDGTSTEIRGASEGFQNVVVGDAILNSAAQIDAFEEANVRVVTGDLIISNLDARINFSRLEIVGGSIYLFDFDTDRSLDMGSLNFTSGVYIRNVNANRLLIGQGSLSLETFSIESSSFESIRFNRFDYGDASDFRMRVDTLIVEDSEGILLNRFHVRETLNVSFISMENQTLPTLAEEMTSITLRKLDFIGTLHFAEVRSVGLLNLDLKLDEDVVQPEGVELDLSGLLSVQEIYLEADDLVLRGVDEISDVDVFSFEVGNLELIGAFSRIENAIYLNVDETHFDADQAMFPRLLSAQWLDVYESSSEEGFAQHFPLLKSLDELNVNELFDERFSLPSLEFANEIEIDDSDVLTQISLPFLLEVGRLKIERLTNLELLDVPGEIRGDFLRIRENDNLSECELTDYFINFTEVRIEDNMACTE